MLLCRVTGSVVSTRKHEKLTGSRFLLVETLTKPVSRFVAADHLGAGVGEKVLVSCGSAARLAVSPHFAEAPVDAAVVGIIDD